MSTPVWGDRPAGRLVTYRSVDQTNKYIKKNRSQVSHYQITELQMQKRGGENEVCGNEPGLKRTHLKIPKI